MSKRCSDEHAKRHKARHQHFLICASRSTTQSSCFIDIGLYTDNDDRCSTTTSKSTRNTASTPRVSRSPTLFNLIPYPHIRFIRTLYHLCMILLFQSNLKESIATISHLRSSLLGMWGHLANFLQPVNWYRQRRTNWEEDQALLDKKVIKQPVLFIQATYDSVLKPEMSKSMDSLIPNLTRGEVPATHWALTQKPEEVNQILRGWLEALGLGRKKSNL